MLVDLDAIPRREPGLEPFEVMISESQERMCAAVLPERWEEVREVCTRWGLPVAIIGRVTADGDIVVVEGGLDADGRPEARCARARPDPGRGPHERRDRPRAAREPADPPAIRPGAGRAGGGRSTGCRSAGWTRGPSCWPSSDRRTWPPATRSSTSTTRRSVPTRSPDRATGPPCCASSGTSKALVASTDGNQGVGALDPWLGAALSVAEATRNVSITGARPLGVTNCLNYGDPTRPEAFWQLSEGVRGLGDACRALGLPVTGGNVSLYNESPTGAIAPTPEIGVVGLLDDVATLVGPAFAATHDTVLLVGEPGPGLAGSAYAALAGAAVEDGPPGLDLAREAAVQAFIREAIARGLVASAQDVSGGGLAVALAESAIWSGLGAVVRIAVASSPAVDLFGESPSRLVVSCRPRYAAALTLLARQHGLPVEAIGTVGGDRLVIELAGAGATGAAEERGSRVADALEVPLQDLRHAWDHGLGPRPRLGGLTRVRRLRGRAAERRGDGRRRPGDARAVRAPAPRPGVGRDRRERRRAADALQGPRA